MNVIRIKKTMINAKDVFVFLNDRLIKGEIFSLFLTDAEMAQYLLIDLLNYGRLSSFFGEQSS